MCAPVWLSLIHILNEGLKEVFRDIAEITDYTGNLVLDFVGYRMDDQPKYTVAAVSYTHLVASGEIPIEPGDSWFSPK